jgi:hypothetical protein
MIFRAGYQLLTSVIPDTQKMEMRRIMVQSQHGQIVRETLSQKTFTKIELMEWHKVKALSSSPSTKKTKERKKMVFRNQDQDTHWAYCYVSQWT